MDRRIVMRTGQRSSRPVCFYCVSLSIASLRSTFSQAVGASERKPSDIWWENLNRGEAS
jgi:hypothetical protein